MLVARALKYSQLSCGHMSTYETMHYKINLQIFMIKHDRYFKISALSASAACCSVRYQDRPWQIPMIARAQSPANRCCAPLGW
jgi:hypothetical protein